GRSLPSAPEKVEPPSRDESLKCMAKPPGGAAYDFTLRQLRTAFEKKKMGMSEDWLVKREGDTEWIRLGVLFGLEKPGEHEARQAALAAQPAAPPPPSRPVIVV